MEDFLDLSKLEKPKKKKRKQSKKIGNTYEREVCKKFNERFNSKEFCRSPNSGAFGTTHNLPEHLQLHSDILTPKNFKFCIECKKNYNKLGIRDLLNPESLIFSFLEQASKDSVKSKKDFIIIWKPAYHKDLILFKSSSILSNIQNKLTFKWLEEEITLCYLDDVLNLDYSLWFN